MARAGVIYRAVTEFSFYSFIITPFTILLHHLPYWHASHCRYIPLYCNYAYLYSFFIIAIYSSWFRQALFSFSWSAHLIEHYPIPRQYLDNILIIPWWYLDIILVIFWWYFDDILMIFWWYSDDILMIFWWYSNDILMIF